MLEKLRQDEPLTDKTTDQPLDLPAALTAEAVARHFLRAQTTDVADILETLESLYRVEQADTGCRLL